MASNVENTGGGTTASFTRAPQAQGDTFTSATTGLAEDSSGVVFLDVMGNDLGGTAKSLWSIDNGLNNTGAMSGYAAGDLLTQDTARAEANSADTSINGARIWITSDGKVGYDSSTFSDSFKARLQGLNEGESLSDTFTYAIRLGNGTLSWTTATVQLADSNDAAILSSAVANLTETDSAADLSTGGALTITDVDSAASFVAQAGTAGSYGTFAIDEAGAWTYTASSAHDEFVAGQTYSDSFMVASADGTTTSVTVNILGTNDAAVISGDMTGAVVEAGSGNNGGTPVATGTLTNTDVDNTPNSFQAVATPTAGDNGYGSYTMAADGTWAYTLDNANAAVEALDAGDTLTDSFTVLTVDGTAQQVEVTINGAPDNSPPVAVNDVVDGVSGSGEPVTTTFEFTSETSFALGYDYSTGDFNIITTSDGFRFTGNGGGFYQQESYVSGPSVVSGSGVDYSNGLQSLGYNYNWNISTFAMPIEMTRVDGAAFALIDANITGYDFGGHAVALYETVTGYLNGQQVAQQSFNVPDYVYGGTPNNLVTLSDPGFSEVDRVEFAVTAERNGDSYYYSPSVIQRIDNLQTVVASSRVLTGIDVLANDIDDGPLADLSIAQYSATSALGAAVTLNPDGTFNYDPTAVAAINALGAGESLDDTFTYAAQDAFGAVSNNATVTLHVQGITSLLQQDFFLI